MRHIFLFWTLQKPTGLNWKLLPKAEAISGKHKSYYITFKCHSSFLFIAYESSLDPWKTPIDTTTITETQIYTSLQFKIDIPWQYTFTVFNSELQRS